jgi:peptidoglycan hydrolase-like amidase
MCQNGARVFAKQGKPFDEILKHYYQGISLGAAPE